MSESDFIVESFDALGTSCQIILYKSTDSKLAISTAHSYIRQMDKVASFYRSDSELTALNVARSETVSVSEQLLELVELYDWAYCESKSKIDAAVGHQLVELVAPYNSILYEFAVQNAHGAETTFGDVKIDSKNNLVTRPVGLLIDFGGLGKSFIADNLAIKIIEAGGGGVLVNLGGDIRVEGEVPQGGWLIKVTNDLSLSPDAPGQLISIVLGGVATSSRLTRRWIDRAGNDREHIVLGDKSPIKCDYTSVTVAASSATLANFYTLFALLSQDEAPAMLARFGLPALVRTADGIGIGLGGWPSNELSNKGQSSLVGAR